VHAESLVRQMFAAFNEGDIERFVAGMHPEIVFVPLLTSAAIGSEPYRGRDGMRQYLRDAFTWAEGRIDLTAMQDFGDTVVAHAQIRVTPNEGEATTLAAIYVARLRDGLVVDLVTLADGAAAQRSLTLDTAPAVGQLDLSLPASAASVPVARRAARAYATAAGCGDTDGVALAVTEAATNVVLHAYIDQVTPGLLEVQGRRDSGGLVISVQDTGRGLLPRLDSPGLGVGLAMMQHFAAEVTFVGPPQRPRGTEVRLIFPCG
jgi:serine/threonine-protein kinase RsbW